MTNSGKDRRPAPYSFGTVLKKYRMQSGIGQGELASALGLNKNTVYNWENDKSRPDVDMIRQLCLRLHIPVQEWLNVRDQEPQLNDDELQMIRDVRSMSERTRSITYQIIRHVA